MVDKEWIRFFADIDATDITLVGGKNASLGELYRHLTPQGVRVPNGFAITTEAYRTHLAAIGGEPVLRALFDGLDTRDVADLARRAQAARALFTQTPLLPDMRAAILDAYGRLKEQYGDTVSLAVRSSATTEDLPTASFAGQHDSYLAIRGGDALIDACLRCFASLFNDRAIHYRLAQELGPTDAALSVGVMKMVRSDLAASGVMFSLDTESGFRDVVFITGSYGLGETVVQGVVGPDEFYVFKPMLEAGRRAVLRRTLGTKAIKMIYAPDGQTTPTKTVDVAHDDRNRFCITDNDVLTLADAATAIERHYSEKAGHTQPMDMEWAQDGEDGHLYLVQARPETVISRASGTLLEEYSLKGESIVLASGRAIGARIGTGKIRVINDREHISDFKDGEVLVATDTTPDWEPIMARAAAIITRRGGRTCHAAIVARELGVPAVVGVESGFERLSTGAEVTVSCAQGETGRVYQGILPFEVARTDLSTLARPATRIMINIGNPAIAFKVSRLPNDGVGLARMEFIINETIGIHPMAIMHPERVEDPEATREIARRTQGYANPADFFVERLSEGIATIAAAFYPKPVVVRLSDFKSNEYAALIGGRAFEPIESNPMLGFRGAARYIHPSYADGFELECKALRRVREDMGLKNVLIMVPFCRRVQEGKEVVARLAELGLKRGEDGLALYLMCEIPNNVLSIDAFAHDFDGFSIGTNDLTQLTLGVDRDSAIVASSYDERDPGVKTLIRLAVEGCRRNGRYSGLCGQAPSDYPEIAEFLVDIGIDSMSLNPDAVLPITRHVLEIERRLGRPSRLEPPPRQAGTRKTD